MENQTIGPFQVQEKLGSHRRHQVYHAIQTEQQRDVALKFIKLPPNVPLEDALKKIQIESDQLKDLNHPNLVKFYGAGLEDNQIFFASRLIKGESLATLLSRRSRLTADLVIDFAKQIASCLSYIHSKGLIHSKLTPDKVLIERRGLVRLIDVRLNRARKRRWDAPRRHQMEIAAYMAPEVLVGKGATRQSDFYSLGVLMYEMLTGELPFEPDTLNRMIRLKKNGTVTPISERAINCPIWLQQVVMSLLDPNAKKRPADGSEIVVALEEIKAFDKKKQSTFFESFQWRDSEPVPEEELESGVVESRGNLFASFLRSEKPWFQNTLVLGGGLVVLLAAMIVGGIVASLPPSSDELFDEATRLVEVGGTDCLQKAIENYQTVISADDDSDLVARSEKRMIETQRKLLLHKAEFGGSIRDPSTTRAFYNAYQAEKEGEYEKALVRYRRLIQLTQGKGSDQAIHEEAIARMDRLEMRVDEIESKTLIIDDLIRDARMAITKNEFAEARTILNSIIKKYSEDSDLRWAMERVRAELRKLDS